MSTPQQPITVNVQSGAGEILRIVSTLLLFGGAGAVAWTVAQGPNAEVAASGLTLMIVMMTKLLYSRGRIALPTSGGGADKFAANRAAATAMIDEWKGWLSSAAMPALAAISIAYAAAFLALRAVVAGALGMFSNLYMAGGSAAILGAVVVFPSLIPSIFASLKRSGVVTTPEPTVQTTVVQAPVVAAPAPAPAPVANPAPAPIPTPTPAPKRVRRAVTTIKKENDHV